mmetsp:Transcript_6095/g.12244  ORF Transcript_6095/g.12244 Transcript_6095/m.12244 type:complete len:200 (-) Transcript_6095:879-1478(-)
MHPRRTDLHQGLPHDAHISHRHVHAIFRGISVQQHRQNLQTEQFVRHPLIEQVSQQGQGGRDDVSIPGFVSPPKSQNGSNEQQFSAFRQFRVDHGDERGVGGGELRTGLGGAEQGSGEDASAANEVGVLEEGVDEGLDGLGGEAVDGPVDGAFEVFPGLALDVDGSGGGGGWRGGVGGVFGAVDGVLVGFVASVISFHF